jgi:Protein of unknown function (DUF2934)
MKRTEGKAQAVKSTSSQVKAKVPVAYEVELRRMVEQQAYFRAECDGFRLTPEEYWYAAEKDVHKYF